MKVFVFVPAGSKNKEKVKTKSLKMSEKQKQNVPTTYLHLYCSWWAEADPCIAERIGSIWNFHDL